MRGAGVHRFAILVAVCAFALVGVGAYLTSITLPIPGAKPDSGASAPGLEMAHMVLAGVVALLTIALALWVRSLFGWIALGVVIAESALGSHAGVLHAILAPILFTSLVAIAVETSESWGRPAVPVPDLWGPLRTMALLAPILVVVQISLGAAFRHSAIGVWWHILNAGIVLLLVMVLGVCLLRQFPEHPAIRPAAIAMLAITGVQVLLGFAVFLILLIVSENNAALIHSSVTHVLTGSLTLSATTVMWLNLRRSDVVTHRSMTVKSSAG